METSSLIIGLVLAMVCALPIIYIAKKQAKTKSKIAEIFKRYNQYSFDTKEIHYKKLYALDTQNKGFLFANLDTEKADVYFVDLTGVTSCRIEEITTGNNSKVIMYFKSGTKENTEIVLYDLENDKLGNVYWPGNEQISKKWQKMIEDCI